MKVAIIGAGNLGLSIAKGILHSNGATSMYLTKRNTKQIAHFEKYGNVTVTGDNRVAVSESDILIFAVQPGHFEAILYDIKDLLTEKHVVISTITGFSIAKIEAIIGADNYVIRSMPNTAISVGKSMTCICANVLGSKRIDLAKAIFNRMGHSLEIPEEQMQAATVICASGVAFWMRLIRATTQGRHPTRLRCQRSPRIGHAHLQWCGKPFDRIREPSRRGNRSCDHTEGMYH